MPSFRSRITHSLLCLALLGTNGTNGASPSPSPTPLDEAGLVKLQNEAANPIADLVSIPFQYNVNFNYGALRLAQQVLDVEPIVPAELGGGHVLINRVVLPIMVDPPTGAGAPLAMGLGDINPQFYYVPHQGRVMIGYGAALVAPTGSPALGQGKWSAGPDAIVVVTEANRVYGLLVNNVWSFAGDSRRAAVNQGFIQPYAHFALGHGLGIGVESTTNVDWNAPAANKWLVPLGPTVAQLVPLGRDMHGQIVIGTFWNVVRPLGAGTFTARLQFTILQPSR